MMGDRFPRARPSIEPGTILSPGTVFFLASDLGSRGSARQLEAIVADTDELLVYPVNAGTAEELQVILPRLLGVRHITHAQQWKPLPQSLYILALYEQLFQ